MPLFRKPEHISDSASHFPNHPPKQHSHASFLRTHIAGIATAFLFAGAPHPGAEANVPKSARTQSEVVPLRGEYAPELTQTLFDLQRAEQKARGNASISGRRVAKLMSSSTGPRNLSLFLNDASLLEKTLGKSTAEVIGQKEKINEGNIIDIADRLFVSVGDRRWLRHKGREYTDTEYRDYVRSVNRARDVLFERLENQQFRKYMVERCNTFFPIIERQWKMGRKTAQMVMTGVVALWDAVEFAVHKRSTGQDIAQPIWGLDQMSNIARLTFLLDPSNEVLRLQMSLPGSKNGLIHSIAQNQPTINAFGKKAGDVHDNSFIRPLLLGWTNARKLTSEEVEKILKLTPEEINAIMSDRIKQALQTTKLDG